MRIAVIGAGYVGLTTAACLACCGHTVVCVESNERRTAVLLEGRAPFHEPGLDGLVAKYSASGQLLFSEDMAESIAGTQMVFIAVGTPAGPDGRIDTSQVYQAAQELAECDLTGITIVNRCTCPPGTSLRIRQIINERSPGTTVVLVNPEFLREGTAIDDFMNPDRIIVGADNSDEAAPLVELYEQAERPILVMSIPSAELLKFAANAYLALSISYINGIAGICAETGADVMEIEAGMRADHRIGQKAMLSAGAGYGGGCLPKDVSGLASLAGNDSPFKDMLDTVAAINDLVQKEIIETARLAADGLTGKNVAIWGLSFKPGTDDVRESASLSIAKMIIKERAFVRAHDPEASDNALAELPDLFIAATPLDAAAGADILLVLTAWPEYSEQDLAEVGKVMASPVMIDGRNIFNPETAKRQGFAYYGVGRPDHAG